MIDSPPAIVYHIPHVTPSRCPWMPELLVALYAAEGGAKARVPFGVLSVPVRSYAHARQIALQSIAAAWDRYRRTGQPEWDREAFVIFFCDRWCPRSVDPRGNTNLKRNLGWLLARELDKRPVFRVKS